MANPVLSEEEIEALTKAMGDEERAGALWDALPPLPQPKQKPEPFAWQADRGDRPDRYPLLVNLHERLAESLRDWLAELFGREVSIEARAPSAVRYEEIIGREDPTLWIVWEEGDGRWLCWMELSLVVASVDAMLAGSGEVDDPPTQLTAVERKLARHLADEIAQQAVRAWRPVRSCRLLLRKMDTDAQFLAAAAADELCFAFEWQIHAGERTQGAFGIAYPRSWLEPELERLRAPVGEEEDRADPEWQQKLLQALQGVPAAVAFELGRVHISIGEFLALAPGDELPLSVRKDDPVRLLVRGVPVATARIGERNGALAAEVLQMIATEELS